MTERLRSVKFWIKAFIPRDVAGYTRAVPADVVAPPGIPGPRRLSRDGLTMIRGPQPWSDCYLTDQRSFSNDIEAKSRIHCEIRIDLATVETGKLPRTTGYDHCDWTTEVDCEDGDLERRKKGKVRGSKFYDLRRSEPQTLILSVQIAASNPCAPSSRYFGDIDIEGTLTVDLKKRCARFSGKTDEFPAYEMYGTVNDGPGFPLFRRSPKADETVLTGLPGWANWSIDSGWRRIDS
jgi:hypothetical protein